MAVLMKKDEVTKVARATDIDFFSLGYKTVEEKKVQHCDFANVLRSSRDSG
jgi:hypothetical protein